MIYLGGVNDEKCVTVMFRNYIVKRVINMICYRDRFIFVKIYSNVLSIVIVQVYMPTTDH